MRREFWLAAALCALPVTGRAGTMEDALKKLEPTERAQQACAIKGVDTLRRQKRLPGADRLRTGLVGPAVLEGSVVTGNAGAVHAKGRWYALKFTCTVTPDRMKATAFSYELGQEIPEVKWEAYGLWR